MRRIGSVWREIKPRCEVVFGEQQFEAIVNTGFDATILPLRTAPSDTPAINLKMADGQSQMTAHGPAEMTLTVAGKQMRHPAYFPDIEPIVGADLLKEHKAVIDMANGKLTLNKVIETTSGGLCKLVHEEYSNLLTGLGRTDIVEHSIDTGDNRPIAIRSRRIPAHHVKAVGRHVQELLQRDVIEEAESDWLFPLVIVRKPDGSMRMTCDLRALNDITLKDKFPMLRHDEYLERIARAKIFLQIDMRRGYYQVMLKKEDRKKTAFAINGRLYHFKRMPFRACNAPQTFQAFQADAEGPRRSELRLHLPR